MCGNSCYKVRDCLNVRSQEKGSSQAQASVPSSDSPKRNRFYALCFRGEQEESPNVFTGMLKVLFIDVCGLLDRVSTL